MKITKNKILLILFTIGLIASFVLAMVPPEKACGSETSGCSIVSQSKYAQTIGINNSYLGLIAFLVLILLTISQITTPKKYKERSLKIFITLIAIGAIYFIFLQTFVIKAFCKYCMIVDIGAILSFLIIMIKWKK